MANLLIYNRASQLLSFHPEWVDGCTKCPGPNDQLNWRVLGFLVRDIASQIREPKMADDLRKLGRSMVAKSIGKGEKGLVLQAYDEDPCPTYPKRWQDLIWKLLGGHLPPVNPDPEPGPDWMINVPDFLNNQLMAKSLLSVAQLVSDKAIAQSVQNLAQQLGKEGLAKGRAVFGG
ncbi:hypothetical protein ACAW74_16910 [Fibrella sp. WM1]|uniref:hypothetical protein n=1 Tax=Fibrella musci TaxID=3242485 RepID=UPI0035210840